MGCVASDALPVGPVVQSLDDFQLDQNLSSQIPYQIQSDKCELPFKDLSEEKIKPLFQKKSEANQPSDIERQELEAYKNKVISSFGMEYNFPNKKYSSSVPSTIFAAKQTESNSLISQDQLLAQIRSLILGTAQFNVILPKDFFQFLFGLFQKYFWNHDQKSQLIKILISYMKYSASEQSQSIKNDTKYNLGSFGETFGNELDKLLRKVKNRNYLTLLSINYSKKYEKKNFSLENIDEIVEMIKQIQEFSYQNTSMLGYLSHYLVKCCYDLQSEGVKADKINQKLRPVVKRLKQIFSPKQTIEEIQLQKNNISEAQYASRIENFDKKAANKFFYFKTADKDGEMSILIMQMVKQAKKWYSKFTQITSQACFKNSGFSYKANLKLKDSSQVMSMLRVKQKLIGDTIKEYYVNKTYNPSTIKQLREAQIAYLSQSMKKINQKMDTVEFIVNDLLRGKCLFNRVEQIYLTIYQLKKIDPRNNFEIVNIVNRLNGITKDVMLKIKVGDIIAEFQLALAFNQIENHIHHKLYQIQRSRVFTPVTMLLTWHESISKDFFRDIKSILNDNSQKNIKNLQKKVEGLQKFMNYSPNLQKQSFSIPCDKKDYQEVQKLKQSLKETKVIQGLSLQGELRSGICLWCMGRYKQAEVALYNYHMAQKIDSSSIGYLALAYYQRGKFQQAYRCMLEFLYFELSMRVQLSESKQITKNLTKQLYIVYPELFGKLLCIIGKFQLASSLTSKNDKILTSTYNYNFRYYLSEYITYSKGQTTTKKISSILTQPQEIKQVIFKSLNNLLGSIKMIVYLFCICTHEGSVKSIEDILKVKKNTLENQYGLEDLRTIEATGDFVYFYASLGRFRQANIYFEKYYFYAKKFIDFQSMDYANVFKILFRYYNSQNQLEKSWQILLSFQKLVKGKNLENMKLQKKIGILSIKSNQYEKALQAFKIAQEICLQLTPNWNKPFFISLYSNMAYAYYKLKNSQKAKQLILKVREMIIRITGKNTPFFDCYFYWVEYGAICTKILLEEKNYKLALYSAFAAQLFYQYKEPLFRQEKCDILLLFGDCYFQLGCINDAYKCYEKVLNLQQTFCTDYFGYHETLSRKYQKFKQYMTKQQKKQNLTKLQDQYQKFKHPELGKIHQLLSQLTTQPQQALKTEAPLSVEMEEFYRLFAFKRIDIYKQYPIKTRYLQLFKQLLERQKKVTGAASPFYGELLMRYFNMFYPQLPIQQKLALLKEAKPIYEKIKHLYIHYINLYIDLLEESQEKFYKFYESWEGWRLNVKEDYFNTMKKFYENFRAGRNGLSPYTSFVVEIEKQRSKISENQCLIY